MKFTEKQIKKAYTDIEHLTKDVQEKIKQAQEIAIKYNLSFSLVIEPGKIHSFWGTDKEWTSSLDCSFEDEEYFNSSNAGDC